MFSPSQSPALLIVGPAWVGDMVMAQSLFKSLKIQYPKRAIDVLAPTWSEGLLRRMPEIRHSILHTIEHGQWAWQERYQLGKSLRQKHYQQAIVLPNSWKSALIPFWAKIPHRTGYVGEMRYGLLNDIRPLDKILLSQTVEQFVALGLPKHELRVGKKILFPRLSPGRVEYALQHLNLAMPTQPILALCPGAEFGPAKCWPLEYYATVAQHKIAEGWQVWLFGSHKDNPIGIKIEQRVADNNCLNLCGKTTLPQAIDLLSLASAIVSNDSGLMHVAAALGKPLIALYGSSSPDKTPPLGGKNKILYLGLKCSPCFQRACPVKHLKCLREIKPTQVLKQIDFLCAQPD